MPRQADRLLVHEHREKPYFPPRPPSGGPLCTRLRDIEQQRDKLEAQLARITADLSTGARLLDSCLQLLENPQELYRQADGNQRRKLNQAIFTRLYVYQDEITGHEFNEPFAELHAVQAAHDARRQSQEDDNAVREIARQASMNTPQNAAEPPQRAVLRRRP